jgi:putative copper export protein
VHVDPLPGGVMATVRFAVFASQGLLFGLALTLLLVARPAVAAGIGAAGIGPSAEGRARVSRRLAKLVYGALIVTLAGTGVALYDQILVTADVSGIEPSAEAIRRVFSSSFFQWHLLRVPLCGALAVALWGRVRLWALAGAADVDRRPPARWWIGWTVLSLALLGTISLSGHAPGAVRPAVAVTNDLVHLGSGATWLSGIVLLTFVLPASWRGSDAEGQLAVLAAAVDRFAPVAFISITVVGATGVVNSIMHLAAFEDLLGSPYGQAVTVKLCGFACIVALGALNHFVLRNRLVRASARGSPTPAQRTLRRAVATEAALAAVILAATSLLVALPPTRG